MALGNLSSQTIRVAPSAPMSETWIAPKMLPVCCVCGLIRDETGAIPGLERWVTPRTYRKAYGVYPSDFPLTHTYCLTCFTKVQATTRRYFGEIKTSL
jgi:hypothetical protein